MSEPFDYGHFDIVLADYLRVNGISKNQLSDAVEFILQEQH